MFKPFFSAALLTLVSLAFPVAAKSLTAQQQLFLEVEKAISRGDVERLEESKSELEYYPLTPYLEYIALDKQLCKADAKTVTAFLEKYPDLPQAIKLKKRWLNLLAKGKKWEDYLAAGPANDGGIQQCYKGLALYHTGKKIEAWKEAKLLWLTGDSQHDACDPLFSAWKKANQLTQELVAQRFWLAVDEGNYSLARGIERSLTDKALKADAQLFWKVRKDPKKVATIAFNDDKPEHISIIAYGINALANKNIVNGIEMWLALNKKYAIPYPVKSKYDERFGLRVAKNFMLNTETLLQRIDPNFEYPTLTEWRIRLALTQQDWMVVQSYIEELPPRYKNESRWLYWDSVARLKLMGSALPEKTKMTTEQQLAAAPALTKLGQNRDFYAFLVAHQKGKPFELNHKGINFTEHELDALRQSFPGLNRAREWIALGREHNAQSEINVITPKLNKRQKQLMPYFAHQNDWHHHAIISAAKAELWDDMHVRFPIPSAEVFEKNAQKNNLDYPWVVAISRQESAFHTEAFSGAGAMGLMQLMPATAKDTAKKARITLKNKFDLFKPEINIALGTRYMAWLSNRFDDDKVLSTAAYNAGGTNVRRWLKDRGHLPVDIFIETIPFDETRKYVQNVLTYRIIYAEKEQLSVRFLDKNTPVSLAPLVETDA